MFPSCVFGENPSILENNLIPNLACVKDSRTNNPAPSPITNPSLSLSKGLEALSGLSLYLVESALALENPLNAKGFIHASTPPATIKSQSPRSINLQLLGFRQIFKILDKEKR